MRIFVSVKIQDFDLKTDINVLCPKPINLILKNGNRWHQKYDIIATSYQGNTYRSLENIFRKKKYIRVNYK